MNIKYITAYLFFSKYLLFESFTECSCDINVLLYKEIANTFTIKTNLNLTRRLEKSEISRVAYDYTTLRSCAFRVPSVTRIFSSFLFCHNRAPVIGMDIGHLLEEGILQYL